MARSAHRAARRGLVWPTALALTAAAVLPILLLGALLLAFQQRSLTERLSQDIEALADAQLARLELLESMAATSARLTATRTQMRADFAALLDAEEPEPELLERLNRILADAVSATADVRAIGLVALDGTLAVSTDPAPHAGRALVDLDALGPFESRVVISGGEVHWLVATPIEHEGVVLGGVVLELDPATVLSLVGEPSVAAGTSTTCVWFRAADGTPVPFSDRSDDRAAGACGATVLDPGQAGPSLREVAAVVALRGEDRLLLDAVDVEGRRVVAATRYVPALDWGVTVTVPRDELLAPVRAGTVATVLLTGTIAILATLAAVLVARWLTVPIRALRDVAVTARGGGAMHADERAPGELGDLAVALNEMIAELRREQRDQVRRYEDLEVVTHAMAHDLKTPLTSIRGTVESLALGRVVDQAERQRMLERGVAASVRLEELIDDLLDLIRTIGDPFEDRPIVLEDVVAGAVEQLGLDGAVDVGPLPVVRGDRVLLERLTANLLSNAAKFHSEGAVVRIAVSADAPVGGRVDVHIDDAGIGIPEAERRQVLDAFTRGTRAPGFSGSGLGLTIASRVAHRHGGALRIGDSPLGGTRVTVTLPVDAGRGPASSADS